MARERWQWGFLGFKSPEEGCPVQDWFDGLELDEKLDLILLCDHLRKLTNVRWDRPDYDPLDGEDGISELRGSDARSEEGILYPRIYGVRNWRKYSRYYIFLHGTHKEAKNDEEGKFIARERLGQLERDEATVHEFDFESSLAEDPDAKRGGKS